MKTLACLGAMLAVMLPTGCSNQKTSTFHGTVSFHGQPVTSGVIYFLGPAPKMQMGMGTIHEDGTYTATDVPVGEVRVSFQAPGIPAKYADPNKSELIYTIKADTTSLDIAVQ
jgi:hypothetical protein